MVKHHITTLKQFVNTFIINDFCTQKLLEKNKTIFIYISLTTSNLHTTLNEGLLIFKILKKGGVCINRKECLL